MRTLKADEIECRVAQVFQKGCSLLLYKTARVDRAILDETFGELWQNDFKTIDGKMYGGIAVYNKELKEWLWRWDCGTESNTEAEKGQASDCFKRAGFKWGIGVELYSAPFIFVNVPTIKDGTKYRLEDKNIKFSVSKIDYSNREITLLEIVDSNNKLVFKLGKKIDEKINKTIKKPVSEEDYNNEIDAIANAEANALVCSDCGQTIDKNLHGFSMKNYGKPLCRNCLKNNKRIA
jgi:hypothetical protein